MTRASKSGYNCLFPDYPYNFSTHLMRTQFDIFVWSTCKIHQWSSFHSGSKWEVRVCADALLSMKRLLWLKNDNAAKKKLSRLMCTQTQNKSSVKYHSQKRVISCDTRSLSMVNCCFVEWRALRSLDVQSKYQRTIRLAYKTNHVTKSKNPHSTKQLKFVRSINRIGRQKYTHLKMKDGLEDIGILRLSFFPQRNLLKNQLRHKKKKQAETKQCLANIVQCECVTTLDLQLIRFAVELFNWNV